MIGRIADLKFQGSEGEDMALHYKIEYILDDVFAFFGLTRKSAQVEVEEETESDSDY